MGQPINHDEKEIPNIRDKKNTSSAARHFLCQHREGLPHMCLFASANSRRDSCADINALLVFTVRGVIVRI